MIHVASMFSDDGYFGNEAYEAVLYTLAALEILPKTSRKKPPRWWWRTKTTSTMTMTSRKMRRTNARLHCRAR
jgi:hypothetical protein